MFKPIAVAKTYGTSPSDSVVPLRITCQYTSISVAAFFSVRDTLLALKCFSMAISFSSETAEPHFLHRVEDETDTPGFQLGKLPDVQRGCIERTGKDSRGAEEKCGDD